MDWYDEIQEAGDRILREARAALYAETGRLGREHAAAYLSGVRWVVDRLRRRQARGREGPLVFMRWFIEDLKKPGPRNRIREDIPEELGPVWVRGRNDAIRAIDAAKHLTREQPPPGARGYDEGGHIQPPGFR